MNLLSHKCVWLTSSLKLKHHVTPEMTVVMSLSYLGGSAVRCRCMCLRCVQQHELLPSAGTWFHSLGRCSPRRPFPQRRPQASPTRWAAALAEERWHCSVGFQLERQEQELNWRWPVKGIWKMFYCQKLTTPIIESFVERFQRLLINNGRLCIFSSQTSPRMIQSGNLFIQQNSHGLKHVSYTCWPHTERDKKSL